MDSDPLSLAQAQGEQEGRAAGRSLAVEEGYRLGYLHGAALGTELGALLGCAAVVLAAPASASSSSPLSSSPADSEAAAEAAAPPRSLRTAQQLLDMVAALGLGSRALPEELDVLVEVQRCRAKGRALLATAGLPQQLLEDFTALPARPAAQAGQAAQPPLASAASLQF